MSEETHNHTLTEPVQIIIERESREKEKPGEKKCARCFKLAQKDEPGRQFMHPETEFSVKKDGKLHSNCKRCRNELSKKWTDEKKEERKKYFKERRSKGVVYTGVAYRRRSRKPFVDISGTHFAELAVAVEEGELTGEAPQEREMMVAFNCPSFHLRERAGV